MWTLGTIALFLSLVSLTGAEMTFFGYQTKLSLDLVCSNNRGLCVKVEMMKGDEKLLPVVKTEKPKYDVWKHAISNFKCTDVGVFTCSCTDKGGNVLTKDLKINIFEPVYWSFVIEKTEDDFTLTCTFHKNLCQDVQLLRGSKVLKEKKTSLWGPNELEYTIKSPTCADAGLYTCSCSNSEGRALKLNTNLISYQLGADMVFRDTYDQDQGTISLSCSAPKGLCKKVEISPLRKDSELTKTVNQNRDTWTYEIKNPQCDDSGQYKCWCTTTTGVLLKKTYDLEVSRSTSQVCLSLFQSYLENVLTFTCLARGGKCTQVQILKDKQLLPVTSRPFTKYRKQFPTDEDYGVYTCKCTTDSGVIYEKSSTVEQFEGSVGEVTDFFFPQGCHMPPWVPQENIPGTRFQTKEACNAK